MSWFRPSKTKYLPLAAVISVILFSLFPSIVNAASYTVTVESEWTFTLDEAQTVYIYGNSNLSCSESPADPHLWLYNSDGSLVTQDDDGNHNSTDQCVSAKIVTQLGAGSYTIRAGYCCSQRGLGYDGLDYELVISDLELDGGPTTTTTTTTTTTSTTTTTVPPSVGPPMNLTVTDTGSAIFLDWDQPNTGSVDPERYAISWRIPPDAGWGVATGNVGDEGALTTEYTLSYSLLRLRAVLARIMCSVSVRTMTLWPCIPGGQTKLR